MFQKEKTETVSRTLFLIFVKRMIINPFRIENTDTMTNSHETAIVQ